MHLKGLPYLLSNSSVRLACALYSVFSAVTSLEFHEIGGAQGKFPNLIETNTSYLICLYVM